MRIRSFVSYGFSLFFSLAFFLLFSLVSSPKAFSKLPEIKSKLSAQSSVDGENILLNIEVTVFEAGHSSAPQPPASMFESWEIDNAYTGGRSEYRTQIQGKIQYRKTTRYHFDLRPLKKGLLKIPPFKIKLGSKEYSTQTFEVDVAKVRIGKLARKKPQRRNREKFDAEDLFPDELFDVERERSALGTPDIFVRGIPHKKEVYIGELIKVPYYVFYKNLTITKTEIGRFPSFK